MTFDDILAIIAGILVLVLLFLTFFKVFTSKKKVFNKVLFSIFAILLALPLWYLIQFASTFILAQIIPENKIVNCIYLNETNCKKRSDCELSYAIGGLGKEVEPICIYK